MTQTLIDITSKLNNLGHTVTCAESCTGGLVAAELTKLPGSSKWFNMGYVHYGAVSEECVREMALGALIAAKADYALAVSGIAGPSGGSAENPVGSVWFGLATKQRIWAKHHIFSGSRDEIRTKAVEFALLLLYKYLYR